MTVHDVCAVDEISSPGAKRVDVAGHRVALIRIEESVYAIADRCSHADVSLSEGDVDADAMTIECWKHGSLFDVRDGSPQTLPATKPVVSYDVTITNGRVMLTIAAQGESNV
jgi:3-phenylpropionate/trans-cinnamate dioxygenase ferredoxin subunit